jgi:acyl carrier protein
VLSEIEVKELVFEIINKLLPDKTITINGDMPLIGSEGIFDSMGLVELCVNLEDKASELGFEFDWTSDSAMSRTHSMFRTAESLATEFVNQMAPE